MYRVRVLLFSPSLGLDDEFFDRPLQEALPRSDRLLETAVGNVLRGHMASL